MDSFVGKSKAMSMPVTSPQHTYTYAGTHKLSKELASLGSLKDCMGQVLLQNSLAQVLENTFRESHSPGIVLIESY